MKPLNWVQLIPVDFKCRVAAASKKHPFDPGLSITYYHAIVADSRLGVATIPNLTPLRFNSCRDS